jgi:hypothetical protein
MSDYVKEVWINTTRGGLQILPERVRMTEAKKNVKLFLLPQDGGICEGTESSIIDDKIPDLLVSDGMVKRYLEISPPPLMVIPEFQIVINEIERSYVLGMFFSATATSCDTIERALNLARIRLHQHHNPKIKELLSKEAINDWDKNIDALQTWKYLDIDFAKDLKDIYKNIRCKYLHSGALRSIEQDALKSIGAAYKILNIFFGFPTSLFRITKGRPQCLDENDPRFVEFYK